MMSKKMTGTFAAALVSSAFIGTLNAAIPEPDKQKEKMVDQFQDNDKVVFIGDSITRGVYPVFIRIFYTTRYPARNIQMDECAIGGDTVPGTMRRLDWDILSLKPNKATIMLGANDAGIKNYGKDKNCEPFLSKRKEAIAGYKENLKKMVERLKKEDIQLILFTPAIYDQTAQIKKPVFSGANDTFGLFADYVKELAQNGGCGWVDCYTLMNKINSEKQKINPSYTIVGPDRSHPGHPGHFLIAYSLLKAQNHSKYVSKMLIDAAKGVAEEEINCKISDLKSTPLVLSFSCMEKALPFPVNRILKEIFADIAFEDELNNEILVVKNLQSGQYKLLIDNIEIGRYSDKDLAFGINLAGNQNTPQYKQAYGVYKVCFKRYGVESLRRNYARVRHYYIKDIKINFDNPEDFRRECKNWLEKTINSKFFKEYREKNKKDHDQAMVYRNISDSAIEYSNNRGKYDKKLMNLDSTIREKCQPKTHYFKIEKI